MQRHLVQLLWQVACRAHHRRRIQVSVWHYVDLLMLVIDKYQRSDRYVEYRYYLNFDHHQWYHDLIINVTRAKYRDMRYMPGSIIRYRYHVHNRRNVTIDDISQAKYTVREFWVDKGLYENLHGIWQKQHGIWQQVTL